MQISSISERFQRWFSSIMAIFSYKILQQWVKSNQCDIAQDSCRQHAYFLAPFSIPHLSLGVVPRLGCTCDRATGEASAQLAINYLELYPETTSEPTHRNHNIRISGTTHTRTYGTITQTSRTTRNLPEPPGTNAELPPGTHRTSGTRPEPSPKTAPNLHLG